MSALLSVWCCGWLWEPLRGLVVLWRSFEDSLMSYFDLEPTSVTRSSIKSTNSLWEVCCGPQKGLKTTNRIILRSEGTPQDENKSQNTYTWSHPYSKTYKWDNKQFLWTTLFSAPTTVPYFGMESRDLFVWNNGLLAKMALFTLMSVGVRDFWGLGLKASEDHSSMDPHGMGIHTV